jgi:ribulose bisphosphate carboxylase small subunit
MTLLQMQTDVTLSAEADRAESLLQVKYHLKQGFGQTWKLVMNDQLQATRWALPGSLVSCRDNKYTW